MKVTMDGMTFESNDNDPLAEQGKQLALFLEAVKAIAANRASHPIQYPIYPQQPWPNPWQRHFYGPTC